MYNLKYILIIFIFLVILFCNYKTKTTETFFNTNDFFKFDKTSNSLCMIDFKEYNNKIYPLKQKVSNDEILFIVKWIKKIGYRDLKDKKNISSYMFGFTIDENGVVNKSRFGIGTLSFYQDFKDDCQVLLRSMNIDIYEPKDYLWYFIAWDIDKEIIKVYFKNKTCTKIICHVYKIERHNRKVKNVKKLYIKKYIVNNQTNVMFLDDQEIIQFNVEKLPLKIANKYPNSKLIIKEMANNGWDLYNYSNYNKKLTLYFD